MTKDMTKGPLLKEIVLFTIPLIMGTLLQLTYNAVDSMIVGRYVGKEALAAVGTTNPLVTLVLLFTNGICLGAGILVGMLYGAGKKEELKLQVSTGMLAGWVFSACIAVLLAAGAGQVLELLQVEEVFRDEAIIYLRIILGGLVFSFTYNYLASMLRAMGDSISPLIFLGVSAVLNIFGDLLFIVVFHMGIDGAAYSTIICEAISTLLCFLYIRKKIPLLRLGKAWFSFSGEMLKKTISYGIVSALQQSTVQMGKIGTQAMVNTMGVNATAAFNATNRFDDFAMIPQQNIGHAMTSVMAQNKGAGKKDRVQEAFRLGMYIETVFGICIGVITLCAAKPLMALFTTDEEVIAEGVKYLHLIAFMYLLPSMTNGIQGYFRGIGDLKITLYSSLINMGVRVASEIPMVFLFHMGFTSIPWSYALGWLAMLLYEVPFLCRQLKINK